MQIVKIRNTRTNEVAEAILNENVPPTRTLSDYLKDKKPYNYKTSTQPKIWKRDLKGSWFIHPIAILEAKGWELSPLYKNENFIQYRSKKFWNGTSNFRNAVLNYLSDPRRTKGYDHFGALNELGFWRAEYHDAVNILGGYICKSNLCESGKYNAFNHFQLEAIENKPKYKFVQETRRTSTLYKNLSAYYWFPDDLNSITKRQLEMIPGGAELIVYKKTKVNS